MAKGTINGKGYGVFAPKVGETLLLCAAVCHFDIPAGIPSPSEKTPLWGHERDSSDMCVHLGEEKRWQGGTFGVARHAGAPHWQQQSCLSDMIPLSINHHQNMHPPPPIQSVSWSFYSSHPGRGSSHFVAKSSCYCSLSALWDACPDPPPPHVKLPLKPVWEDGHWQTRLSQYSPPFPPTVHLLVLRLVLGYLYCLTPINISWRIFPLRSWICCNLSLTPFRVPPKVKSRTQQEFVKQPFDVCVNILCYFLLYYLVSTILANASSVSNVSWLHTWPCCLYFCDSV